MKPVSGGTFRFLFIVIAAAVIPTIGCFSYYTLDSFDEAGKQWATWIILAYPLSLTGLLAMLAQIDSRRRTVVRMFAATILFVVPAVFLIIVRS